MNKQTLEQALAKIAADNGLDRVDVGRMPVEDRIVFCATVHWTGFAANNIPCATGHSDKSIRHAMEAALEAAAGNRAPIAYTPPVLPSFEAEAA